MVEALIPQWVVDGLKDLGDPDQGMSWSAADYGRRKYDPDTGKPYMSGSRPETLTVYNGRAAFLYRLICESKKLHAALARAQQETAK